MPLCHATPSAPPSQRLCSQLQQQQQQQPLAPAAPPLLPHVSISPDASSFGRASGGVGLSGSNPGVISNPSRGSPPHFPDLVFAPLWALGAPGFHGPTVSVT